MALISPISGRLADRRGRRFPSFIGGIFQMAAALLLVFGIARDVSYVLLALSMAMLGLGVGLGSGPATTAAIESAPQELAGTAAGTISMMRYIGSIVGAGLLGGILSTEGTVPGIVVFRVLFAVIACTAGLATLAATSVHRFAGEERVRVQGEIV